jgi:hypothetical protein
MRINQNDFKFLEKFRFWENAHYKDKSALRRSYMEKYAGNKGRYGRRKLGD